MNAISFGQSGARGCIQSPGRQKGKRPQGVTVNFQVLAQQKTWPGYGPSSFSPGPIFWFDDPSRMTEPPLLYKINFRNHWLDGQTQWSQGDVTYDSHSSFFGSVPKITGMPLEIHGDPAVLTGSVPETPGFFPFAETFNKDWTTDEVDNFSWTSDTITYTDPTGTHPTQITNKNLAFSLDFPIVLSILKTRLANRVFPAFSPEGPIFPERFSEWNPFFSVDTDPSLYTGLPVAMPATGNWPGLDTFSGQPNFFGPPASPGIPDQTDPILQSFWYYSSQDRNGVTASDAQPDGFSTSLLGSRCRFKADKAISYFIAEGQITDNFSILLAPNYPYRNKLANASILSQGIAAKGQIIEIGLPGGDDFDVYSNAGGSAEDGLDYGRTRFAILGETPAQWSARSGVPI